LNLNAEPVTRDRNRHHETSRASFAHPSQRLFPRAARHAARIFLIVHEPLCYLANTVSGVVIGQTKNSWMVNANAETISENKGDNKFSFSGGVLVPRDPPAHPRAPKGSLNSRVDIPFKKGGNIDQAIIVHRSGWQR
jgi:hypothetical protein